MRKRWLGIFALCFVGVVARSALPLRADGQPDTPNDYVVVQFKGGVSAQAQMADGKPPTLEEQGFHSIPVPKGVSSDAFLAQLRTQTNVASAERDPGVTAAAVPNDSLYGNEAQYLTQIGAPAAWDLATGSNKVVVAVIDSGIDLNHPEFAGRLWTNPNDIAGDGIDNDNNGCIDDVHGCRFVSLTTANHAVCGYTSSQPTGDITDDSGTAPDPQNGNKQSVSHGTFVSGIIGAAGNNATGVTGLAWNVSLMPLKVLDCGTDAGAPFGYMSDVAAAINYATRMGANIINLSLSSVSQSDDTQVLRSAIAGAQSAGVIIVAAAGNYGQSGNPGPGYPGAYTEFPNVITVGAANQNNGMTRMPFSAWGPALDFAAPGGPGIASTFRSDLGPGYGVDGTGGTSYATPMVAGMFALMMSRNSRLNAADYISIARATATPAPPMPGGGNWAGSGVINIGAAVARVPMSLSGSALRDWKDVPNGTEVRASIDGNDCGVTNTVSIGPAATFNLRIKSASEAVGCGVPGKTVQISIAGVPAQPALTWGGQNQDLSVTKNVSTVSPPPGAVVVQALNGSWSNIAYFDAPGNLPAAFGLLPTPWTAAYRWDPGKPLFAGLTGAYDRFIRSAPAIVNDWSSVQTYDTFWVDAPATNLASLNPNPPAGRVLQLQQGWNNFVYTGASKEVSDALSEVTGKYTEVLQYDNANKTWLINVPGQKSFLQDFGGLFKLKVYWVYMNEPGSVTMN